MISYPLFGCESTSPVMLVFFSSLTCEVQALASRGQDEVAVPGRALTRRSGPRLTLKVFPINLVECGYSHVMKDAMY